jgi:hypothetical protein
VLGGVGGEFVYHQGEHLSERSVDDDGLAINARTRGKQGELRIDQLPQRHSGSWTGGYELLRVGEGVQPADE